MFRKEINNIIPDNKKVIYSYSKVQVYFKHALCSKYTNINVLVVYLYCKCTLSLLGTTLAHFYKLSSVTVVNFRYFFVCIIALQQFSYCKYTCKLTSRELIFSLAFILFICTLQNCLIYIQVLILYCPFHFRVKLICQTLFTQKLIMILRQAFLYLLILIQIYTNINTKHIHSAFQDMNEMSNFTNL